MGRMKVKLKKIEDKNNRNVTFAKRRNGLVKKAYELSTLCDVEVALIIVSSTHKLVLFDGKTRVEETLKNYIDYPHHQRERLPNEEMVRRLVAQMSEEADLYYELTSDKDKKMIDTQLKEIKTEISLCNVELEDVEEELKYFGKSSSCIKSISNAEYHERVLEETLELVTLNKQKLEEKSRNQRASQTWQPQTASADNFMMGSPNCDLGGPQQSATN